MGNRRPSASTTATLAANGRSARIDEPVRARVRAQDGVRVVVGAGHDAVDLAQVDPGRRGGLLRRGWFRRGAVDGGPVGHQRDFRRISRRRGRLVSRRRDGLIRRRRSRCRWHQPEPQSASVGEVRQGLQRDRQPGRTVPGLVHHFVYRLVEGQRAQQHLVGDRVEAAAFGVPGAERVAVAAAPLRGRVVQLAGVGVGQQLVTGPRSRTSAACPATSRSGEDRARRWASGVAGSPSKSSRIQPARSA